MKLVRYGAPGQEKPGLLDAAGRVRCLSAHLTDVGGQALAPETLARLALLEVAQLPIVPGVPQKITG